MSDSGTAKLFKHGRSQAVRLPKEYRMPGTQVRVRRIGRGVLLEPIDMPFDVKAWFAKIDEYLDGPFMLDGREQPSMPPRRERFVSIRMPSY
jgi:antitoxin VapB